MAGEKARELHTQTTHFHAKKVTYQDTGTIVIGDVPPCLVTRVYSVKATDFNFGSTSTIDIGVIYSDGTQADQDALVDGANLASATAQGPLALSIVDSARPIITAPATLTATLVTTGTAASTGETTIVVEYVPLSHVA